MTAWCCAPCPARSRGCGASTATQTTDSEGVRHVVHSEPSDYDGVPLADILAAERAWVDGG